MLHDVIEKDSSATAKLKFYITKADRFILVKIPQLALTDIVFKHKNTETFRIT